MDEAKVTEKCHFPTEKYRNLITENNRYCIMYLYYIDIIESTITW